VGTIVEDKVTLMTKILAIETSCDETAAAVIQDGRQVLSNVVATQIEMHAKYGGVFPELASRMHVETIVPVVREALDKAEATYEALDAVAVTYGPGLPGSLLVGLNVAKGIALGRHLPLIGINHLEGHVYSHWLRVPGDGLAPDDLAFPVLILIVSGGHTELILMHDHLRYEKLGATADDASGEAFDKVARLLQLGYPGGPKIEKIAVDGNPHAFRFARPKIDGAFNFSFSGIKTAVRRAVETYGPIGPGNTISPNVPIPDLAASFQHGVIDQLVTKTVSAADKYGVTAILLSGGVSANKLLRYVMKTQSPVPVYWPPLWLCTDNAAMIGAAAHWRFLAGQRAGWDLDIDPNLKLVE
jgi:N6-L-threonylcarbamoyladenine synthase